MRAGQSDKNLNRLWVPLALTTERQEWLLVAGRLKPGVTLEQAREQMAALDRTREDRDPNEQGRTITVDPLKQSFVADSTALADRHAHRLRELCLRLPSSLRSRKHSRSRSEQPSATKASDTTLSLLLVELAVGRQGHGVSATDR